MRSYDRCSLDVRALANITDGVGLRYGDRVEILIIGTVVRENAEAEVEGGETHHVVVAPYDGRVVRIVDEMVPRRRRKRRGTPVNDEPAA